MGRIIFVLTLVALGNAGCSNSQTAAQPGYSHPAAKVLDPQAAYGINGEERHHMDDYLPRSLGSG